MLSVPPAFVLSQDQTLYENSISKQLSSLWNQSCSITLALLLRIFYSLLELFLFSKESQGSLLFLHCSIFKMLFAVLLRQLFNYITVSFLCQAFFESFLNFLFSSSPSASFTPTCSHSVSASASLFFFLLNLFKLLSLHSLSSSALLLYHLYLPLSTLSCVYFICIYFCFFVYFL